MQEVFQAGDDSIFARRVSLSLSHAIGLKHVTVHAQSNKFVECAWPIHYFDGVVAVFHCAYSHSNV